jgi:hypothetical protein
VTVGGRGRRPRVWRTIGQRKRRARVAQVSAVAIVLGLLLFTSMLYSFVINQIPNQMTQYEFDHELTLEDQLGMLQSDILAEASVPTHPAAIVTPVTLGSSADPPFAPASTSSLVPEPQNTSLKLSYVTGRIVPTPPNWGSSGTCSVLNVSCAAPVIWENITGVANRSYFFSVTGLHPVFFLNFSGNYSTIQIYWASASIQFLNATIQGVHDRLVLIDVGSVSYAGARVQASLFGGNDIFRMAIAQPSLRVRTWFSGTAPFTDCPAGNLSRTDAFYWNGSGAPPSSAAVQSIWFNAVGWESSATYNLANSATLAFQNQSGAIACAFTQLYASRYFTPAASGIAIHLNNRYMVPADIVYDEGAVILSHPGLGSIMVDPPNFNFLSTTSGTLPTLELVNAITNNTGEEGTQNAAVVSQLVATQTFTLTNSFNGSFVLTGIYLNLTTEYPFAWNSFFETFPANLIPGGVHCTPTRSFSSQFSCLVPPAGVPSTLSLLLITPQITIQWVTADVGIL